MQNARMQPYLLIPWQCAYRFLTMEKSENRLYAIEEFNGKVLKLGLSKKRR